MWSDAINAYQRTIDINPDKADTYIHMGMCYMGLSENKAAIQMFNKFLQLTEHDAPNHFMRSYAQKTIEYLKNSKKK
jgi:tetratricopeptide (TPR) repeat protein